MMFGPTMLLILFGSYMPKKAKPMQISVDDDELPTELPQPPEKESEEANATPRN